MQHTAEFINTAIRLAREPGADARSIAAELSLEYSLLKNWLDNGSPVVEVLTESVSDMIDDAHQMVDEAKEMKAKAWHMASDAALMRFGMRGFQETEESGP